MTGNRGFYDEKIDSASVYGNSRLTQFNKEDTLKIFADKFITKKADNFYELFCFHNVNILGNQLNGKCDSLYYYEMDSLMYFYDDPVLWIEESQMTGDLITFKIKNGKVYNMEIKETHLRKKVRFLFVSHLIRKRTFTFNEKPLERRRGRSNRK